MKQPQTILIVVNPDSDPRRVIEKACRLTRHCQARLEVFVCDATRGYWLDHAWDQTGVDSARCAYIEETKDRLRKHIDATICRGQSVTVDASCESPFHMGVAHKIEYCGADLLVKEVGDDESSTVSDADMHLIRSCSKPLLLTQQNNWPATPSVAAAVDMSSSETPGLARQLVDAATWLAGLVDGKVNLVCAPPTPNNSAAMASLQQLADCFSVPHAQIHLLSGDPMQALPLHVTERQYDLVVLGALGHAHGLTDVVGSLPYELLHKHSGDLLLLKPEGFAPQLSLTNSPRAAMSNIDHSRATQ